LCFCTLAAFLVGCETTNSQRNPLAEKVDTLEQDNRQLASQIEQLKSKNKDLHERLDRLHGLSGEVKLENLYDVQKIKIAKRTDVLDKDKDGKKETLVVYIQPIDQDGDIVKAAGAVEVQLNDWEGKELGRWSVKPGPLRKLWFNALMMTNYRLTFDVSDKVGTFEEPLTVKVTFTDYLTGRVYKEQQEIKP
jgi:hypothetical protein